MAVFITGATGFLGRNLLAYLVARHPERQIICLVRDLEKAKSQWPESCNNVNWLPGDLLAPDTYRKEINQAELVFHVAALVSLKNGPEFYTQNTETTRHLLEALRFSQHLQRLVFVSSISAVDRPWELPATELLTEASPLRPNTDYGQSKLQAERLIQESGLPYTIMIPAYIYGPYPRPNSSMERLIRDMVAGKGYTRFPFPGEASAIHVADLAIALWLAASHQDTLNERFFIANPEPIRIQDAYALLAEALGLSFTFHPVDSKSLSRYENRWRTAQPDSLILRILFERYFACSAAKWYQTTRYQPRYTLGEGIDLTVNWYREQGFLEDDVKRYLS